MNTVPNPYNLQTPLGQALGNAISATGQVLASGPSKWDQARTQSQIDYSNAAADKTRAETTGVNAANAAPAQLADVLRKMLAPRAQPVPLANPQDIGNVTQAPFSGQPVGVKPVAEAPYYESAPDLMQAFATLDPKNGNYGDNMRAMLALLGPGVSDQAMTTSQLGAGQAFNTTIGGTREGFTADQKKQDSVNSTSRLNNYDDNAMKMLVEQASQAGQDRRWNPTVAAGATGYFSPQNPAGTPTVVQGAPTQDTVQAQILQSMNNAGQFVDPNEPMVAGSPAAVLTGATSMPGTGAPRTGKNWAAPDGTRGVTVDGVNDQATGKPLPQGWQYSTDVNPSGVKLKAVPAGATQGMLDNKREIDNIDKTIAALDKAPASTGWKGYLGAAGSMGNNALNALDPSGTDARANIANIGSMIIHDRSGAAVTISETPRLAPFVPLLTDSDPVVRSKLARLRAEIKSMLSDQFNSYSPDTGYIGNPTVGQFLELDTDPQGGGDAGGATPEESKTVGGKTYVKVGGQWYEQ